MFVTPDGHAFWLLSVYHANEAFVDRETINKKHGANPEPWVTQAIGGCSRGD